MLMLLTRFAFMSSASGSSLGISFFEEGGMYQSSKKACNLRFNEKIKKSHEIIWSVMGGWPGAHPESANAQGMTSYKYLLLFCLSISLYFLN